MAMIDLEILIDYLGGSAKEEEKKHVEEWISASDENKEYFEKVSIIWNAPPPDFPKPDTETALKIVLAKIESQERTATIYKLDAVPEDKPYLQILTQSSFIRVAAAIIIMVGAVYLMVNLFSKKESSLVHITSKDIRKLELSDGTKVTLDAGSSFDYPEDFSNSAERKVTLNGEAYFEVARNENVPFIVHANSGLVKVLGTKFNVRAWDKSEEVIVAVAEGKVSLKDGTAMGKDSVVLTKGKMSTLTKDGALTEPVDIDISQYLSWLNREVYFKNKPFIDVIDRIERWYNINIELQDSTLLNNRITVFIENKPLEDNIKLVCMLMNLRYEIRGNTVKLFPAE